MIEQFLEMSWPTPSTTSEYMVHKTPIAVIGKPLSPDLLRERLNSLVVETEIEHRVHHAGHRGARPDRTETSSGLDSVTERLAGNAADLG